MKKSNPDIHTDSSPMASEPAAEYGVRSLSSSEHIPVRSVKEPVLANTVSVDEYFDELISLVHHDYADL